MTQILIDIRRPNEAGELVNVYGEIEWYPSVRYNGEDVIVEDYGFITPLSGMPATVEVIPNNATYCWAVVERTEDAHGETDLYRRYVTVPDSATPINYVDLVDVDPNTYLPPVPAPASFTAVAPLAYDPGTMDLSINQSGFDHLANLDYLQFDTTNTTTPTTTGRMAWNQDDGTLDLKLQDGVTLQMGQEFIAKVANYTNALIPEGAAVRVSGAQGQRLKVTLAAATDDNNSATTLGVVTQSGGIPHGTSGYVTIYGLVRGIDTRNFNDGDILWLSATPGQWSNVKPVAPTHLVQIGYVVNASNAGSIYVHVQNGYELDELHNVLITNPQNGDILKYNATTKVWYNTQP